MHAFSIASARLVGGLGVRVALAPFGHIFQDREEVVTLFGQLVGFVTSTFGVDSLDYVVILEFIESRC